MTSKMTISDAKKLVAEKLGWNATDMFHLFYLTTDKDQFSYYIVSKNHCIKAIAAIDELIECVSNIWK